MIKIAPFQPWHLEAMKPLDIHQAENIKRVDTLAMTFLIENDPIGIIGWFEVMPGVLQVWALLSEGIKTKPLSFHRSVKQLIEHAFDQHELRRMQMSVRVGYTKGWEWANSLGFMCEGTMRNYGPDGSAYWLFARIAS